MFKGCGGKVVYKLSVFSYVFKMEAFEAGGVRRNKHGSGAAVP